MQRSRSETDVLRNSSKCSSQDMAVKCLNKPFFRSCSSAQRSTASFFLDGIDPDSEDFPTLMGGVLRAEVELITSTSGSKSKLASELELTSMAVYLMTKLDVSIVSKNVNYTLPRVYQ
jgi:hypothetical protein